jgi:hypothetical protein
MHRAAVVKEPVVEAAVPAVEAPKAEAAVSGD